MLAGRGPDMAYRYKRRPLWYRVADIGEWVVIVAIIVGALGFLVFGKLAVNPDDAVKSAKAFGFKDPVITNVDRLWPGFNGCGEDDMVAVQMTATGGDGQKVAIVACGGVWKGWTVRLR